MTIEYTERFKKSYETAPKAVQKCCDKQLLFLLYDIRHPSLHAKKYDEAQDIWQARINNNWRLYFTTQKCAYILVNMSSHPK